MCVCVRVCVYVCVCVCVSVLFLGGRGGGGAMMNCEAVKLFPAFLKQYSKNSSQWKPFCVGGGGRISSQVSHPAMYGLAS